MSFLFSPVSLAMLASAALPFGVACYGLAYFHTRGAKELIVCCLMVTVWAASNAMEYSVTDMASLLVWTNIQYFAYAISPLCWFILIFRFNGKEKYVTARNLILLSIVPAITSILVWFDPVLGLVRHSFSVKYSGNIPYLAKVFGPWFWVHYVYSYAFNLADMYFLIAAVGKKGSLFRRQSIYILVSVSLVFATNIAYVLGYTPIKNIDLTSVSIGLSALVLWWGILRHKIFRIPPIARTKVFERTANGILVVDEKWNLIDSNEAAQRMFNLQSQDLIGKSLRDTLIPLKRVTDTTLTADEGTGGQATFRWEIMLERPSGERFFELNASRLLDHRYKTAWVIIAADITDLKLAQEQIIRQREELATAAERDRLSMELHDTLGQVLSFAVIQTDTVLREMGRENYILAASYITRLRGILRETHGDLRGFVHGIRATEYEAVAFADILEKEAERLREDCGVQVSVSIAPESIEFEPFQKAHLAYIVKEALNNIAKHAVATKVSIDFTALEGVCTLVVHDDGIGLPKGREGSSDGSGMDIMRERARSINGKLSVCSVDEGGTRVLLSFPMASEKNHEHTDS